MLEAIDYAIKGAAVLAVYVLALVAMGVIR